MDYSPEMIAKYLWVVLIGVVLLAVVVIIFEPGKEVRSECTGFQYFFFISQKMTPDKFSLELLNSVRDVKINGLVVEGTDVGIEKSESVESGDLFLLNSVRKPTNLRPDETFRYKITIFYDMVNGIEGNRDIAMCTGRVQ
jgi:hypothetical protein